MHRQLEQMLLSLRVAMGEMDWRQAFQGQALLIRVVVAVVPDSAVALLELAVLAEAVRAAMELLLSLVLQTLAVAAVAAGMATTDRRAVLAL